MSNAIAAYNATAGLRTLERPGPTDDEIAVIKATVMPPDASDAELKSYLGWCAWKQLDPVGQAYCFRQKGQNGQKGKLTFGTSIHGMRSIAARTGVYGPQDGPYWCGPDGEWKDLWLEKENPAAARVGVKQIGWETYTYGTATWQQWGKSFGNWLTMPAHMLAIRAEADALRRAFPHDLAGVYLREELEEAPADHDEAQVASPRPIEARVVDRHTGEITNAALSLDDDIKRLRANLGWSAQDVIADAGREKINLRTQAGKQAMVDRLQQMYDTAFSDAYEGAQQDSFIDAESRVAGEPGMDRHSG